MKFYFVAGERSGDLHGGNLIKSLSRRFPGARYRGFGGDYMEQAGMELVVHYKELAFMGFLEVIINLRTIKKLLAKCQQELLAWKPDVIVLIDYAGFNMRVAAFARAHGIKVYWYISPKVWAWNRKRAWKLKANIDHMFVILPFEKEFFQRYDWQVDYVGNPVLDAIKAHEKDNTFSRRHDLDMTRPIVALLPGSRVQELKRMIPVMAQVAKQMPQAQFVVAALANMDEEWYLPLREIPSIRFVYDETYDLLNHATAAIVTSGTATLETALWRVPQVVIYKASPLSYLIARSVIKVPFISLVNLIAGKEVVKELIQRDMTPERVTEVLQSILSGEARTKVLAGYDEVIRILDTGSASENTAELMKKYLTGA